MVSPQQLKNILEKRKKRGGRETNEKIAPSFTSAWRAELEDLSLLEGKELAARELVACSCIFSATKQGWEKKSLVAGARKWKRAGY